MDFEFAAWQMVYLFVSPQKVFRNFNYRKREYYYTLLCLRDIRYMYYSELFLLYYYIYVRSTLSL